MDSTKIQAKKARIKRAMRVRKKVRGSADKPRLTVHRSNKNIFVQVIDDIEGKTLLSLSTISKECKEKDLQKKNKTVAQELGKRLGELAKEKGIKTVLFDRGSYKFHGVVAAVALGARESGLEF